MPDPLSRIPLEPRQLEFDFGQKATIAKAMPLGVEIGFGRPVAKVDPPTPGGAEMAWGAMLREVWEILREAWMGLAQMLRALGLQPAPVRRK